MQSLPTNSNIAINPQHARYIMTTETTCILVPVTYRNYDNHEDTVIFDKILYPHRFYECMNAYKYLKAVNAQLSTDIREDTSVITHGF
jgi:hypothetical protein